MSGRIVMPVFARCRGLTLIELLLVLVILVALSGIVVAKFANLEIGTPGGDKTAEQITTEASMNVIRDAIFGTPEHPGFYQDMNELPRPHDLDGRRDHPQIHFLFVNPDTGSPESTFDPVQRRGWRGRYLMQETGRYPGPRFDGWEDALKYGFTDTHGRPNDYCMLDGWGHPIVIDILIQGARKTTRLLSAGSDGLIGSADDIVLVLREERN